MPFLQQLEHHSRGTRLDGTEGDPVPQTKKRTKKRRSRSATRVVAHKADSSVDVQQDALSVSEPLSELTEPLNGFGLADALIEPIQRYATLFIRSFERQEIPPQLIPLTTSKRKPKANEISASFRALGRHEGFTQAAFDVIKDCFPEVLERYEGFPASTIIEYIDELPDDPPTVVSALIVLGKIEHAKQVAEAYGDWQDVDDQVVDEEIDEEEAEAAILRSELSRERRRLKREISRTRRLEAAAVDANRTVEMAKLDARTQHESASRLAGELADALEKLTLAEIEVQNGRRIRSHLLRENGGLQLKQQELKKRLRKLREQLPREKVPPPVRPAPEAPPPSLADLRMAHNRQGIAGPLESKRVWVIVDGYNFALGDTPGVSLEDKRRSVEQALQRYMSRTKNKVTVIWDGQRVPWFPPSISRLTIERYFSVDQIADDAIVEELEVGKCGLTPIVITSDKELTDRCAKRNAYVIRCGEFRNFLRP